MPVSAYEQGMILLSAIPDKWDHVAAYYVQTCTSVANMSFDAICKAILAEFDCSGGSHPDQSHVADKISAIKRKGKCYDFSYFALFTYVFSLFLEVSHGAAALTHFSLAHIAATLLTHSTAVVLTHSIAILIALPHWCSIYSGQSCRLFFS